MEEVIARIECEDDEGETRTVILIQEYAGPGVKGLKRCELDDGTLLNYRDGGKRFEAVSGESFRAI